MCENLCFTEPESPIADIKQLQMKQSRLVTDLHRVVKAKNEAVNLRRLALGIQLGRTETFFDNEGRDFIGFILFHSLQEPFITLIPVLTLRGPEQRTVTMKTDSIPPLSPYKTTDD